MCLCRQNSRKPAREESEDEEFAALVGETKMKKLQKKQRMKEKAEAFLPQEEEEVEGQRRKQRSGFLGFGRRLVVHSDSSST